MLDLFKNHSLKKLTAPDGKHFHYPLNQGLDDLINDILIGKEYPIIHKEFLKIKTIIDIGAHVGTTARYFNQLFPFSNIYCFEPHPINFKLLSKNTKYFKNVKIFNCGLGANNATSKLYEGIYSTMQASYVPNEENEKANFTTQIRSANEVFNGLKVSKVSILKIDTEGMELEILESLQNYINTTSILFIEFHSEYDRVKIDALLNINMILFHAHVFEPNRGTFGYINKELLQKIYDENNILHFAYPKK